jgi:hypothetical protein
MAQATAENLLIRIIKEEKGRTRNEAMRWLLLLQRKLTAKELGIDLDAASEKEQSALAGMVRNQPANKRETFADATAHGPQIDPANSVED